MIWHIAPENDYRAVAEMPLRPEPTVTVVIPVYNRVELLERTISGLVASTYPHELFDVVVADDGSEDEVAGSLAAWNDQLRLTVVRQDHVGYGAGRARNMGAQHSNAEVLVFIDADCIPDPDLITRHVDWHRRADNLVIIGSRHHLDTSQVTSDQIVAGDARLREMITKGTDAADPMVPDDFRRVFYQRTARLRTGDDAFRSLVSSNFSIRRDRFLESGGFAEDFSRWGGEDTELGWRLFNAGLFFVPENAAVIYHQTQEDGGEGPQWRQEARQANDGVIQSKIPHRFYRKSERGYVYETPKVSWLITPTVGRRAHEVWDQILRQSLTDFEVIFCGADPATDRLGEMLAGDPRVIVVPDTGVPGEQFGEAIRQSRGEYLAILHGWASLDHRLLGRAVRRMEGFPRSSLVRCGYQVVDAAGSVDYVYEDAIADLDRGWQRDGLPIFALSRRREWAKILRTEADPAELWDQVVALSEVKSMRDAMVAIPGPTATVTLPDRFPAITGERSHLVEDLTKGGPKRAAVALSRYAAAKARRQPYRPVGLAERVTPPRPATKDGPPGVTYVGWLGRNNFGDEVMFQATQNLFPNAVVAHDAPNRRMVMLGGGTLINRMTYLENLRRYDTPRVDKVVFGSGVADPSYWGVTEPVPEWLNFLDRCRYVGVRGPRSEALLREWGYEGALEVLGDPGLSTATPDAAQREEGLVVVSPAWTHGELWGKSDESVFAALAGMVRSLRGQGRRVAYLSCHPGDDRHIMEIMKQSATTDAEYIPAYDDLEAGTAMLARADVVVAERLHAAVTAAACGTPFVAIEYRPKLRDFARSVGQEDLTIRTDEVAGDRLASMVTTATDTAMVTTLRGAVAGYRGLQQTVAGRLAATLVD